VSEPDSIIPRETVLLNAIHALRYRASQESRKDPEIYGGYVRELRECADMLSRELQILTAPEPQSLRA